MAEIMLNKDEFLIDNLNSRYFGDSHFLWASDSFRADFGTAIQEAITGCHIIDTDNEIQDIKARLHRAQELFKNGYIGDDEATLVYKKLLEAYLNIKIWDFFVNRFIPEKAGASRINQFCQLIAGD
jgi:hypothetical protein